nr:hypothetical protein [Treponema sp.]
CAFWEEVLAKAKNKPPVENYYFHPTAFLSHLSKVAQTHAEELMRVQKRIVKMKCLEPGGVGPRMENKKSEQTWCNYAVYFTIRALDEDFIKFTGRIGIPDKIEDIKIDSIKNEYKISGRKPSNIWCDVLEYQANQGIIKRIDNPEAAQQHANQGYVVIVCWKNLDSKNPECASPHFATIAPGYNYDHKKGCMIANVGGINNFMREKGKNTAFGSKSPLKYYYNPNQKFREDYRIGGNIGKDIYFPSIESMENLNL